MNPFTLNFGMIPSTYIPRKTQEAEVISGITAESSMQNLYMITGLRGAGKTVFLTEIEDYFRSKDWLVFDLSIEMDLLQSFAFKLYNHQKLRALFDDARLNLSQLGIGIEIKGEPPITDLNTAIECMLDIVKSENQKVLIAIDEAVDSENMKHFLSTFYLLMQDNYPVCLLLSGLIDNINDLRNDKTLSFLSQVPKIMLEPLNKVAMVHEYKKIFNNTLDEAREMANLTKGYAYAYQVMGYLCYKNGVSHVTEDILKEFDAYMDEYVYSKIWQEQSLANKQVLKAIASSRTGSIKDIRKSLDIPSEPFSNYCLRFIRQGLIEADGYEKVKLILPRFSVFMANQFVE